MKKPITRRAAAIIAATGLAAELARQANAQGLIINLNSDVTLVLSSDYKLTVRGDTRSVELSAAEIMDALEKR